MNLASTFLPILSLLNASTKPIASLKSRHNGFELCPAACTKVALTAKLGYSPGFFDSGRDQIGIICESIGVFSIRFTERDGRD